MISGIKDYALIGMAIAIAALLWRVSYVSDELDATQVLLGESRADQRNAEEAARLCSRSIDALKDAAKELEATNAKLVADSKERERDAGKKAQDILIAQPSTPGDSCKSAEDLARNWLKGRGQ